MCGIAGYFDLRGERDASREVVSRMARALAHRGPDSSGHFVRGPLGLGFRRLSIIDLETGDQPIFNEDRSIALICNGEIFNYRELRRELISKGHSFYTESDVEVLVHLYEEEGQDLLHRLNGQFAFALYDLRRRSLLLARDHFGVNPLHYAVVDDQLIFGSEIKALLEHPAIVPEVDLTGLDQTLSFPGLVSPRTLFKGIASLPAGHYLTAGEGLVRLREYWDLDYPRQGEAGAEKSEEYYVEKLRDLLFRSVRFRLQADVPVGFYLSGGMDSSLLAAAIKDLTNGHRNHSFSIAFLDEELSEARYQRLVADFVDSEHHETVFDAAAIAERLTQMVYHCECPVKESFNTCSLALSEAVRTAGVKVVLAGEGADELFAGYMGYRFDRAGVRTTKSYDLETVLEDELRELMWGDRDLFYEKDQYAFRESKLALYSSGLRERFAEFDSVNGGLVNKERLQDRDYIHQRSYLDFKLRLSEHLLSEHGDRMLLANSVEGRYPFLDVDLVEFATEIPPHLKLNGFSEKYILKELARDLIPRQVLEREKFGFRAPGSPYLLQQGCEWAHDMLSPGRIARQGYFDPEVVSRLSRKYSQPGFRLNAHLETDFLMVVLTFGILVDRFGLPALS